ncbi:MULTISPECIES: hypothetical protein [unclassified Photobacterium]|uniref:hypothetical protein n=1 Tax=unclassified Photobacterium TaxID=2628852 RepID=UPI0011B29327|nr:MULTISPECIES: hypothetical protein [unclassified Photobacterium]
MIMIQKNVENNVRAGFSFKTGNGRLDGYKASYDIKLTKIQFEVPISPVSTIYSIPIHTKRTTNNNTSIIDTDYIQLHIVQNTCGFVDSELNNDVGDMTPGETSSMRDLDAALQYTHSDISTGQAGISPEPNTMYATYTMTPNEVFDEINRDAVDVHFYRNGFDPIQFGHIYNDNLYELNHLKYQVIVKPIKDFNPRNDTGPQFGRFLRSYTITINYY